MRWIRLDRPGRDRCELSGTTLTGHAEWQGRDGPGQLSYRVTADAGWRSLSARVTGQLRGAPVDLTIEAGDGWRLNGTPVPGLAEAQDIDLFFTPATNTLPIRRLLAAGTPVADVTAAWLAPDLTLRPLRQRYARTATDGWRYESPGFRAELTVTPDGLVRVYPGLWSEEAGDGNP